MPRVTLEMRFIPDGELPDYLGAADIVVLPFRRSLTSGSVALAASYGLPIVAPRLPSVTAVTGEKAPFLYEPAAENGLARAMERSLAEPLDPSRPALPRPQWSHVAALHAEAYAQCRGRRLPGR